MTSAWTERQRMVDQDPEVQRTRTARAEAAIAYAAAETAAAVAREHAWDRLTIEHGEVLP